VVRTKPKEVHYDASKTYFGISKASQLQLASQSGLIHVTKVDIDRAIAAYSSLLELGCGLRIHVARG
jgi:hypothetical protein